MALVVGVAGLPLLVVRAIGFRGARRTGAEVWAARFAIAFVLAGGISTLLSATPMLSLVGPYDRGSGLLFMVVLAGWWALGTGIRSSDRHWLEDALVAGAILNASLAILQQLFGLGSIGLGGYSGQPDGFLGNPVFLGALLAAALVLIAPRVRSQPRLWWLPLAVVGVGLGVDGERLPALLALVVVGWEAVSAWSRRERDSIGSAKIWHRTLLFGAVTLGSIAIGSLVARLKGGLGVISHTASSTSGETFGERFHAWTDAAHAFVSHPIFGYGPGLFESGISRFYSLADIRIDGGELVPFPDAHNVLVDYVTTTGVIGVGLLLAWLVFSVRGRSGPLLGFAAVIGAMELVEPLNVVITPLALLALGASIVGGRSLATDEPERSPAKVRREDYKLARWVGPAGVVLAVLATIPALYLVIGDTSFESAMIQQAKGDNVAAAASGSTATRLLAPWPDPATFLGGIHLALASASQLGQLKQAEHWAKVAVARDPTNAELWSNLAQVQGDLGESAATRQSALNAIKREPWFAPALGLLGVYSALHGNNSAAERWFEQSLEADPNQKYYREVLTELKRGCKVGGGSGSSGHELVCPR